MERWYQDARNAPDVHSTFQISKNEKMGSRRSSLASSFIEERLESRVLVLYTGGTIGMEDNANGVLAPSNQRFVDKIKENLLLHDPTYNLNRLEDAELLVLPTINEKRRVLYKVIEYVPLLDSSNMGKNEWINIANDIEKNYTLYDGFVVLHGTDTLSYTASALSFMLENLGKPVILTGSQISIFQMRSDAFYNLIGALLIAGNYNIPEVLVFFNNKAIRGNRTIKISSDDFDAFDSPNYPPLVKVGLTIDFYFSHVFRASKMKMFTVESSLSDNVGILRVYPNISIQTFRSFLQAPIEGVVLHTYGSGNFPSNRYDLVNALKEACDRNIIAVNCSQCSRGRTRQTYETGKILQDIGVINGSDMTPEAALTKLAYILAKSKLSISEKKHLMSSNIRGEMTTKEEDRKQSDLISALSQNLTITDQREKDRLQKLIFPAMLQAAARKGDIQCIMEVESLGADLSMTDSDERTILHTACSEGKLEVVRYCLQKGVDLHVRDRYDMNALHEAVVADHHNIIKLLRECGAHLSNDPRFLGDVLTHAAARGMVERLISYKFAGVDLNQADTLGLTPLHAAVMNNEFQVVEILLANNVDTKIKNKFGKIPVQDAEILGFTEIMDLLNKY